MLQPVDALPHVPEVASVNPLPLAGRQLPRFAVRMKAHGFAPLAVQVRLLAGVVESVRTWAISLKPWASTPRHGRLLLKLEWQLLQFE